MFYLFLKYFLLFFKITFQKPIEKKVFNHQIKLYFFFSFDSMILNNVVLQAENIYSNNCRLMNLQIPYYF